MAQFLSRANNITQNTARKTAIQFHILFITYFGHYSQKIWDIGKLVDLNGDPTKRGNQSPGHHHRGHLFLGHTLFLLIFITLYCVGFFCSSRSIFPISHSSHIPHSIPNTGVGFGLSYTRRMADHITHLVQEQLLTVTFLSLPSYSLFS